MKPRWPRFSLRALIIAVLAIGLCWTLTATWGVSSYFNSWQSPILLKRDRDGNSLRIVGIDDSGAMVYESKMHAIAVAPFFIRITGNINTTLVGDDYVETYFWFFGYLKKLTGLPEAIQKR